MYKLIWPEVTREQLFEEVSEFFKMDQEEVKTAWTEYSRICNKYKHSALGEKKTLNTDETFVLYLMLKLYNPASFIEIGTLLGRSTRRLLDIKKELRLPLEINCYDIVNKVTHFKMSEVKFHIQDITNRVKKVIDSYPGPGMVYLDAHPYYLTTEVIRDILGRSGWVLAVHDCGEALCNPRMAISKDDPGAITSQTGHWERYCLAEVFGVSNPLDKALNSQETATHKMRIFSTLHGICSVVAK